MFDGTAERPTELVLHQFWLAHTRLVIEPIIRRSRVVAVIQIHIAMPLVGSAPSDKLELTASSGATVGGETCGRAAKFLNGIYRCVGCDCSEVASQRNRLRQPIDGGVGLILTCACRRTGEGDAGLQREKYRWRSAVVNRQIVS